MEIISVNDMNAEAKPHMMLRYGLDILGTRHEYGMDTDFSHKQ